MRWTLLRTPLGLTAGGFPDGPRDRRSRMRRYGILLGCSAATTNIRSGFEVGQAYCGRRAIPLLWGWKSGIEGNRSVTTDLPASRGVDMTLEELIEFTWLLALASKPLSVALSSLSQNLVSTAVCASAPQLAWSALAPVRRNPARTYAVIDACSQRPQRGGLQDGR